MVSRLSGPGLRDQAGRDHRAPAGRSPTTRPTRSTSAPTGSSTSPRAATPARARRTRGPASSATCRSSRCRRRCSSPTCGAPGFDGSCDNTADIFGPPPCDVTTFATGLRNTYDFVFHSNGSIYGPDNGLGRDRHLPALPHGALPGHGEHRALGRRSSRPQSWPAARPPRTAFSRARYYGHPNPYRDECVFKDGSFQGVAPPPNYSAADSRTWGTTGRPTGRSSTRPPMPTAGRCRGDLLIANYSVGDDLTRVELSEDGHSVAGHLEPDRRVQRAPSPRPGPRWHRLRRRVRGRDGDGAGTRSTRDAGPSESQAAGGGARRRGRGSRRQALRGGRQGQHAST